jgi:predicted transcriptional regulator
MATPEPISAPAAPTEQGAARRVRPADDDVAHIQAGLAEAAAGKGVEVTPEELAEWERRGELPASLEARLATSG